MFSELVDTVVLRSGRAERKSDIIAYANTTFREMAGLQTFTKDLVEDQITPTTSPAIWTRPRWFRAMRIVKYTRTGYEDTYPDFKMPGRIQREADRAENFYYAAADYFVFSGVAIATNGVAGQTIDIAYYRHLPRLSYYASGSRPAIYNDDVDGGDSFTYLVNGSYVSTTGDDDDDLVAQSKVTNWILKDYKEIVEEGTLAKLFKSIGDQRAIASFALYKSFQQDFLAKEPFDSLDGTMGVSSRGR